MTVTCDASELSCLRHNITQTQNHNMHSFSVSNISYNAQQIDIKLLVSIILYPKHHTAKYDMQIYLAFTNLLNSKYYHLPYNSILFFHFQTNKILIWPTGLLFIGHFGTILHLFGLQMPSLASVSAAVITCLRTHKRVTNGSHRDSF